MRTIDAEYLLYGMGMFSERYNGVEVMRGVDAVADMIENMPTISPADNWIPCAERLPEHSINCLATVVDTRCGARYCFEMHFRFLSKEWEWSDCKKTSSYFKILAWRPLPAPWTGEKKGEADGN